MKASTPTPTLSSIVSAIKLSANHNSSSILKGKSLHAHLIKSGFLPEIQLFNHLLNMYSKSTNLVDARNLFDEMPHRNLISFSTLISGYSQSSSPQYAFTLLTQLHKLALSLNQFVFSSSILACSKLKLANRGKQIHAQVIISGFESDPFVKTSLIDMYSKFDDLEAAVFVFGSCPMSDPVMYNSMISGYVSFGFREEALGLFEEARRDFDFRPTEFTFGSIIKACAGLERDTGEQSHGLSIKTGFESNCIVGTSLVDMYSGFGDMESMRKAFGSISSVDLALYNALIVGFSHNNFNKNALEFFGRLKSEGFDPDECTFSSVLKACSGLKCLNSGRIFHGMIEKSKFRITLVVSTSLVDMYMKCEYVEEGCKVFYSMSERNAVLYNSLIFGHGQNENFNEAVILFNDMNLRRLEANHATLVALSNSCSGHERSVYVHAIKRGYRSDLMVQNALLDSLIKRGVAGEAQDFFSKMRERDVVSWTTIISGMSQLGLDLEALELFKEMRLAGISPNSFTFSCISKARGGLADLEQVRCIHGCGIKHGVIDEEFTNSSLLDVYAKTGALEESYKLFNELRERDIVSWNSMISGCAQHGYGAEALRLLERMEMEGVEPNHVTFVSALTACSHCGLVDEGVRVFELMTHKHGIVPSTEHYACMVDMYGRAGMLDRAKCVIDDMPFESDALVWRVLLAACKLHGDVELAQIAGNQILSKGGRDSETLVLMSNVYSGIGRWDDVEEVRKRMRDYGVRKEAGFSWIQIKGNS